MKFSKSVTVALYPGLTVSSVGRRDLTIGAPPRRLDLAVIVVTLLGDTTGLVVWAFALVAMLALHAPLASAGQGPVFGGPTATVPGTVTVVSATSTIDNGESVHSVVYRYEVGGERYAAAQLTVAPPPVGAPVTVEYLIEEPSHSGIVGLRTYVHFDGSTLWFLGAPAIALAIVAFGARRRVALLDLLRRGDLRWARVVDRRETGETSEEGAAIFEIDLEWHTEGGAETAYRDGPPAQVNRFVMRTTEPARFDGDHEEPLLVLPEQPGSPTPCADILRPDGTTAASPLKALALVVLALVVVWLAVDWSRLHP